jgi:hypothetical protein
VSGITSEAVFDFAKQGHPQALAVMINRDLVPRGAHVKVQQKGHTLQVLINFLQEAELQQLQQLVQKRLENIQPQAIQRVQIFSQQLGHHETVLRHEYPFKASPRSHTTPAPQGIDALPKMNRSPVVPAYSPPPAPKVASKTTPSPASVPAERYSVAEFLAQVSRVEELELLKTHPIFTATCPTCGHAFTHFDTPPLFWDCPQCGWVDDLSKLVPRHHLKETPQRQTIAQGKRLGNYLVDAGLLTPSQIEVALADQQLTGLRLGEVLVRRGWIKEETVEYFMKKVIEPDRHDPAGQANAYLESSRNLMKTLMQQKQSASRSSSASQTAIAPNNGRAATSSPSTPTPPKITKLASERDTLILPDVDIASLLEED